jgi:hypothetical protein
MVLGRENQVRFITKPYGTHNRFFMATTSALEVFVPTRSGSVPVTISADPAPDPSIKKQKEKNVNVPTLINKQKNVENKIFVGILKATKEKSRIRIRIRKPVYGSDDPH